MMYGGIRGRWLRGAAAGLAVAAVLAGGTGAAPAPPNAEVALTVEAPTEFGLYDAAEGREGRQDDYEIFVRPAHGVAENVEVTVDARELKKVGTLTPGHRCTGQGAVFRCRFDPRDLKYGAHSRPFHLRGKDGVAPGDGGTVRITARADNTPTARARTRLEVRPPDLIGNRPEHVKAASDGVTELRPSFANPGRWTVRKYALKLSTYGHHMEFDRRYRNCWYSDGIADPEESGEVWCEFSTPLPPHSAWRVAQPLRGKLQRTMPADSVRYEAVHGTRDPKNFPYRGSGPELDLERVPSKQVRESRTGASALLVRGPAQMDYAPVVQGKLRGRVGDTVSLRIGVRNVNGGRLPGPNPDHVEVVPPEGTTITSTPYEVDGDPMDGACAEARHRERVWICDLGGEAFEGVEGRKGARATVTTRIRIDRKVPGARGSVRAVGKYDRTHGNDTVALPAEVSEAAGPSGLTIGFTAVGATAAAGGLLVLWRRRRAR
ncbi:hypothetical protein DY218_33315 [Streptomyces triticagri]|uniref:Gram-positive cocci surface proteins LPxTG domain-containing protein n=2 Tax=Streptomyces triticagri TaxID=2293568 RepID=A0A372LVI9_9ACTN|nr:hypothetical protein DY218_33315 [Streptomyces triticagri]